ncbi:MAG: nucleoside monophosphate kinase [Cytophagales bacterium]|nr:nucleoside monophosphate kinase [Cytophagales bacterium]
MPSLIFLGPPGAGKGTQIKHIITKYDMHPVMLGELMREEVKNKTPLGVQVQAYIDKGFLAPHELAMNVTERKIKEYYVNGYKNLLFDGFPREEAQATALDQLLASNPNYKCFKVTCVIFFKVSDDEIVKRIHKRSLTSGRVDDADDDIIKRRIKVFYDKIFPVKEKYEKLGLLTEIDGEKNEEEVSKQLDGILSKYF